MDRREGRTERAVRLLAAADAQRETLRYPRLPIDRSAYATQRAALRDELGGDAFAAAWEGGWGLTWEQAAALPLDEG